MYFSAETIRNCQILSNSHDNSLSAGQLYTYFLEKKQEKHKKKLFAQKWDFRGNSGKKNTESGIFGTQKFEEIYTFLVKL